MGLQKLTLKKVKNLKERKYLQIVYLVNDQYTEYIKNTNNSTIKRHITREFPCGTAGYCNGSGCFCGTGWILGLGTSEAKRKNKKRHITRFTNAQKMWRQFSREDTQMTKMLVKPDIVSGQGKANQNSR